MDDFRSSGEVGVLMKWQQKIKLKPVKKNLYGKVKFILNNNF